MARHPVHYRPGDHVTHAEYGWGGRLAYQDGKDWCVIWDPSEWATGWSFSMNPESVLRLDAQMTAGTQAKLFEEISGNPH